MASYVKFDQFVADQASGVHNLGSDTLKVLLTNVAPNAATAAVKADLTEITGGNGYTAGGVAVTVTSASQVGGIYTLAGHSIRWTAAGGSIGPFRYAVLYNSTPVAGPLIAFWDKAAAITLQAADTFDWLPDNTDPGTILELT